MPQVVIGQPFEDIVLAEVGSETGNGEVSGMIRVVGRVRGGAVILRVKMFLLSIGLLPLLGVGILFAHHH